MSMFVTMKTRYERIDGCFVAVRYNERLGKQFRFTEAELKQHRATTLEDRRALQEELDTLRALNAKGGGE